MHAVPVNLTCFKTRVDVKTKEIDNIAEMVNYDCTNDHVLDIDVEKLLALSEDHENCQVDFVNCTEVMFNHVDGVNITIPTSPIQLKIGHHVF